MLSKGSELFMFEGAFYKLKARWINQSMTEDSWTELLEELTKLKQEYKINNVVELYVNKSILAFIDFMRNKEK